jgi:hypothetical protein
MKSDASSSRRALPIGDLRRRERSLAKAIGVVDSDLLANLRVAGYTPETIALIEFAPLARLAWADGHVSHRQRSAIVQVAVREHILDDTPAGACLRAWLESCPSDDVFDVSLSTIRAKLDRLPLDVRETAQRQFIKDCTAVARVADGVTGDNKIAPEEGRVLARILVSLRPSPRSH